MAATAAVIVVGLGPPLMLLMGKRTKWMQLPKLSSSRRRTGRVWLGVWGVGVSWVVLRQLRHQDGAALVKMLADYDFAFLPGAGWATPKHEPLWLSVHSPGAEDVG